MSISHEQHDPHICLLLLFEIKDTVIKLDVKMLFDSIRILLNNNLKSTFNNGVFHLENISYCILFTNQIHTRKTLESLCIW